MYKGAVCTDCCEIMYTCMAKEYTLINCMDLAENIFFTHARTKDVCVCVCTERITEAQQRFLRALLNMLSSCMYTLLK